MATHPESRTWLHVRVEGRVQGVGFRWFVLRAAESLHVTGWVRNLPDGSVEVSAVGSAESIARLREQLVGGPPHARVDRLAEETGGSEPQNVRFQIVGRGD